MFEFDGMPITLEQIQESAKKSNMDIDSYIKKASKDGLIDKRKPEELGKKSPATPGAVVEEAAAPNMDSKLESGLLEYTEAEPLEEFKEKKSIITEEGTAELRQAGDGKFQPIELEEVIVTGKDKTKIKEARDRDIRIKTMSAITKMPETGVSITAGLAATTVDILNGFANLVDKFGVAPVNYAIGKALGYDTTLKAEVDASIGNYEVFENVSNLLHQYTLKKYDKEGNEQDVVSLIEKDNYVDAAELAFNQGFSAAPYLALSIASPIYGSALIGASVTGQEVEKALKERPDASLSEIYGASILKGGVEFATNAIGGGLQRGVLGIGKKLGTNTNAYKKAVDIYTKTYLGKVAESGIGLTKGGATNFIEEWSASMGNALVDAAVYNDPFEFKSANRQALNEGLVGLALGSPVGSLGAFNSLASKQQALEFLAPKKWQGDMAKQTVRLEQAKIDLNNAPLKRKEKFQKRVQKIESLIKMKKQQLQDSFDNLTKKEKKQYADNLNKSAEALSQIGNSKYTLDAQNIAKEDFNEANKQNENLVGKEIFDAEAEKYISKTLKNTERINEAFQNAKQDVKNVKFKYISDINADFDATFDPNTNTVIVNEPVAVETEQTNVIGHELLHYMIAQKFATDNASMRPLVDSFKNYLKETQPELYQRIQERIDLNYTEINEQGQKVIKEGALEEYFNVFSDLVAKEKIIVNESLSDKIKNTTTRFLNGLGFGSIKLETGKDVFNFIRNYQKNISDFKFKQLGVDLKSSKIPKAIQKAAEESQKFFSKSGASDKVQQIYNDQGVAGAMDIIERFNPIVNKLVNKYRDVPGFEYQILKDEIETGQRGILDMIMAYNPEKNKGVPLAAYINKFLPSRMIEIANRNLGTEFTLDVTEAKGVTDTATEEQIEAAEEAIIADEIKSLRKEIGLPEELITKVKNSVIKAFGTRLPNPQDPKFRLELQRIFRTELKKPMAKFVGKQEAYESFLRDNFKAIYDKMPLSLILKRFKEFADPVLDENGKQKRERTAEGNKIFVKKKLTTAEFVKYFLGSDVGRSTQGTRKTAIVEGIAEEIAFDATMEVLQDPKVYEKYEGIVELTEGEIPNNLKALIAKQIDRNENIKFSKSLIDNIKNEYNLSQQELAKLVYEKDSKYLEKNYPLLYSFIYDISEKELTKTADIAEKLQLELFNRVEALIGNSEIFEVIDEKITADDSSRVDHHVTIYNKKTGIEKKLNYGARYGQVEIGFEIQNNDVLFTQTSKDDNFINVANYLSTIPEFVAAVKNYAKEAGIIKTRDKISLQQKNKLQAKGLQAKVSIKIPVSIETIKKHYRNKTKDGFKGDYIIIGEDLYHLGENPLNLDVTEFNGEGTLNIRLKLSADKNKIVAIRLIGEYKVKPSSVNKKGAIKIKNESDFIKLINKNKPKEISATKFSKSLNKGFNEILQASTGIKWTENYSPSTAKMLARGKGKGNLFIPYSAEDFVGLLYTTLSKGKVGDQQMEWYNENLIRPFSRGIQAYEAEKQRAMREWSVLKQRATKDVPGGLKKQNESGFTNEESLRMYIWQRQGIEIPKIQKGEVNKAIRAVRNNEKFKAFADTLMALNPEGYPAPSDNWIDGDITSDLVGYVNGTKRAEFLTEWKNNVDQIFSEKNKTKLRALYGDRYVEALEDMLFRMERGTNRSKGTNKQTRAWMDWVNNSVGTIMFFNARSAVLQTLSTVNFINFSDNNPINAAAALANFGQYRQDFVNLFNSDFLKQRRSGLQIDVNADEIAKATKGSEKSPRAILRALLQFGFTPTQIADSFAIAAGGATFYRNRINKYIKEGLSKAEAEKRAFTDFQEIAEETQQSARPDRISMEQASSLGRVILAFANTPMQYARLQKKAFLDLINGRGDWKTNTSKIMYYGVIQNIIFSALQQALFALMFDDEDEAEKKTRYYKIGNASLDTLLRGVGVGGAALATVKNIILEIIDQAKSKRPDYTQAAIAATSISPPINSKLRKLLSAGRAFTYKQSREKIFTEGLSLENPALLAAGQVLSAGANIPADRIVIKADHLYTAMQPETELWQAIALSLGWSEWDLGMIEKQTTKAPKIIFKPKSRTRSRARRKTR